MGSNKKDKVFILVQTLLIRREMVGNRQDNYWENVVRKVTAESNESAIGKFVLQTSNIEAIERMGIECILLDIMKSLS